MARTPSAEAHKRVLDAALELFSERGIDSTSMDAIAESSGVSKATIYKHWADKEALCLDVLSHLHEIDSRPTLNSGDVRTDLVAVLSHRPSETLAAQRNRMMPHLMGYAARNPTFATEWRSRVMEPPRRQVAELLKRGIRERVLATDLRPELGVALLLGPMMFEKFFSIPKEDWLATLPEMVVTAFWRAYGVKPAKPSRTAPPVPVDVVARPPGNRPGVRSGLSK